METSATTFKLLNAIKEAIPLDKIAVHFHDTYGQALANILTSLQMGVSVVDSSIAGLGGCPYAKGATGNVATEDVVYMLDGMGIETGIRMDDLVQVTEFVETTMKKVPRSKAGVALLKKK